MTGFGRAEHATDDLIARVEISSVNRKQADIVFNLPRELSEIESTLRKTILTNISRGRVHVSINLEPASSGMDSLALNETRAKALENAFTELSNLLGRPIQADSHDFLRAPGVFQFQEGNIEPEQALAAIQPALTDALSKLVEMRTREAKDLKNDFLMRLEFLENATREIEAAAPHVVTRQRENLHQRLREAEIEIDLNDERLLKEITLFAERCDIASLCGYQPERSASHGWISKECSREISKRPPSESIGAPLYGSPPEHESVISPAGEGRRGALGWGCRRLRPWVTQLLVAKRWARVGQAQPSPCPVSRVCAWPGLEPLLAKAIKHLHDLGTFLSVACLSPC